MDDAKSRGELPKRYDTARHAQALLALVVGMRVMARGRAAGRRHPCRASAGGGIARRRSLIFFDLF